jgi:hypothetical protein
LTTVRSSSWAEGTLTCNRRALIRSILLQRACGVAGSPA